MIIHQPSNFASDLLLGIVALICAQRLFRMSVPSRRIATRLWGGALLAAGSGAILGGVAHAIGSDIQPLAQRLLWTTVLYLVGLGSAFMLAASARAALQGGLRRIMMVFVWLKFLAFAWWVIGRPSFQYVIIDYASAMAIVLMLQAWGSYRRREASASWITGGIVVSMIAALIQMRGYDLHRYFDHNDQFHLVQMVGVVLFFQGAKRIRPRD